MQAVFEQATHKGAKGDTFNQIEKRLNSYSIEVKNSTQEPIPAPPTILDKLKLDKALKLANKKEKDGLRGSQTDIRRYYKKIS